MAAMPVQGFTVMEKDLLKLQLLLVVRTEYTELVVGAKEMVAVVALLNHRYEDPPLAV
jgi:hypothetical protein